MKTVLLFVFLTSIPIIHSNAQNNRGSDAVVGVWQTGSGKGRVQIYRGTDGKYHGKIIWLKEPNYEDGKPKVDKNNPDPNRKKAPLLGLLNLRGFVYDGDNVWVDGQIYDPEKGKDYSCKMTLVNDGTLDVRGFIGISLIGRTDTWKRVPGKS
jgi:uncharacterized protein (DUF2147 family)